MSGKSLDWTVDYSDTAKRQLKHLDRQTAKRIMDFMDERVAETGDPRSFGKALRGPLGDFWRYRVGGYRLICDIQDNKLTVLVVRIGDRKEVYRGQ
jgi:mRNA interferase RelE/StbE